MDVLNAFVFLLGILYMIYATGAVFVFAFCFIMVLGIVLKEIFFPKKNDYLGPLI